MTTISSRAIVTAFASLMLVGTAFAQTSATPAPTTPATKSAPTAAKTERTAISLECSKQADAKGLHGKERKKFRSACKRDAGKDSAKAK